MGKPAETLLTNNQKKHQLTTSNLVHPKTTTTNNKMLLLSTAKHSLKKKWNKFKSQKNIAYQKVQNHEFNQQKFEEEEDDNLANERLEFKILQIFKLETADGIPANPDNLFALLDDGSFIQFK